MPGPLLSTKHGHNPPMRSSSPTIDFKRLFKLRLVVARHGEMDAARWWNTQGVLGPQGVSVLRRGFPKTHCFAQARIVFEVARSRCHELFDPPGCMTLWSLPAAIEEQFQEHWQRWLDEPDTWMPVFQALEGQNGTGLLEALADFELISAEQRETVGRLRRAAENRAVPIAGTYLPDDNILTLLAAGFSRGEPGNPAIPYARLET
jgi:hypothetical protein